MKTLASLNVAVGLSALAFLSTFARTLLDIRFVPEVYVAMQEDQPLQSGLFLLVAVIVFGLWLWALLAAVRNSRAGLIGLFVANLLLGLLYGLGTAFSFCPAPCPVTPPLSDIVIWIHLIIGALSTLAVGLNLWSRRSASNGATV